METPNERPNDLMNPCKAAELIGVHLATIYRWFDDGTLPFWVIGKRQRRVSRRDVMKMVRAGKPKKGPRPVSAWELELKNQKTAETLREFGLLKR